MFDSIANTTATADISTVEAPPPSTQPEGLLDDLLARLRQNVNRRRLLSTINQQEIEALPDNLELIVNLSRLNDARFLNKYLEAVNRKLACGGLFVSYVETTLFRKRQCFDRYPYVVACVLYVADFVLNRIIPRLSSTRRLYFFLTKGRNRAISRAEIMGRIISCGFEIFELSDNGGKLYFTARKVRDPYYDPDPSYGPFFKMRRVGFQGRMIDVIKIRTMHPYSEYIQQYIHSSNGIDSNGKFKNDFRVTSWGRFFRKTWIDELPMLYNLMKGDIKLIGVRPLSEQYLSLYPDELIERRLRTKPGLIPPFYADMPDGFDEIISSEAAYLDSYERHPVRTDIRYFFHAFYNIFLRQARSG